MFTFPTLVQRARPAVLALPLLLPAFGTQATEVLLDDFKITNPAFSHTATGTDSTTHLDFTPTVPGGVREVTYNLYSNPQGSEASWQVGEGVASVSAGEGALGEYLFSYGSFTRPTGDPLVGGPALGWDLSAYRGIELVFSAVDQALNINYTLHTFDPGSGLFYNGAGINAAPATPGGPMSVVIPFAATAFNFNQVDGVFFEIDRSGSSPGNHYVLDEVRFVTSVPEPHSFWLMSVGLVGAGACVRRRRGARG
jgi:hypothetical protein